MQELNSHQIEVIPGGLRPEASVGDNTGMN